MLLSLHKNEHSGQQQCFMVEKLQDKESLRRTEQRQAPQPKLDKNKVSRIFNCLVPMAKTKHQTQPSPGRIKVDPHTEGPLNLSIYVS